MLLSRAIERRVLEAIRAFEAESEQTVPPDMSEPNDAEGQDGSAQPPSEDHQCRQRVAGFRGVTLHDLLQLSCRSNGSHADLAVREVVSLVRKNEVARVIGWRHLQRIGAGRWSVDPFHAKRSGFAAWSESESRFSNGRKCKTRRRRTRHDQLYGLARAIQKSEARKAVQRAVGRSLVGQAHDLLTVANGSSLFRYRDCKLTRLTGRGGGGTRR